MKKLFIGLFFVLLSISINIGEISIDLIPDFIGYLLLISGLREFTAESGYFGKAAKLSIIFTVFLWRFLLQISSASHIPTKR